MEKDKPEAKPPTTNLQEIIAVQDVFQQVPLAICILTGPLFRVEFANDYYLQLAGKTKSFIGKPIMQSFPELESQGIRELLEGVMETGTPFEAHEMELELVRNGASGKGFFSFIYQPLHGHDGRPGGIIIIANEVTELVLARKGNGAEGELVHNLLMSAPAFVCTLIGPTHIYSLVNDRYQQLFGSRKIQGKPVMVALPELEGQGFDKVLDKVYATGEHYVGIDIPIVLAHDVGQEPALRYFNFSYQPMFDDAEAIYGILVFGYEVTEQVIAKNRNLENTKKVAAELEEKVAQRTLELHEVNRLLVEKNHEIELSKEKLLSEYSRRLIEASLDPLIAISAAGKITDVNHAMVAVTDVPREGLIGSDFTIYFTEPEAARAICRDVFEKESVADFPLTIKDHKLTDVLFNGSVYKDENGVVLGAVIVARDITEQKRVAVELTEAKVFAELATSFAEEAKIKAEKATLAAFEAVKSKQQFLSNMSHEIRTPMNAIIGFTKVMQKTELSVKQREFLTAIKLSGDALIVLINDILDLAKVDSGKMSFELKPFKLELSVAAMLHLFETKILEKNLSLVKKYDPRIPAVLLGDPVRLHQIIINLVSNAVKFTHNGQITVDVALLEETAGAVKIEFSVADTGIGIEAANMTSIFDNFQQASSSTSRLYGGTGLGLAIVKQLVEAQGGSVGVTSEKGAGSRFNFILDFQKTTDEAEDEADLAALETDLKNIRVLVVEDMALNQLLMKTLLDEFGFEREIAENGRVALEKMESQTFDIILMDLQMPVMNGFETTAHIRNVLKLNVPIIALTADVTTMDLEKCTAVGMNDYLAKPVDERILYQKIINLVKKTAQTEAQKAATIASHERFKCTDLEYLNRRTKSNPALMMEMLAIYLEQTPPLIRAMKTSFQDGDWHALYSAVHKMIPSFSIMGMSADFENMAKKVQKFAATQQETDGISEMVATLEKVLSQSCEELQTDFNTIKNAKS